MNGKYFVNCTTLEELKQEYNRLVKKHHPDLGGDTRTMQEINAEHDKLFNILKKKQNKAAENSDKVKHTTETPEEFRAIVEKLIILDGVEIELCGSWLWVGGETFKHKDALKAAGCKWSRTKKMWYWYHAEEGRSWSRGKSSMADIRNKYGSEYLTVSAENKYKMIA